MAPIVTDRPLCAKGLAQFAEAAPTVAAAVAGHPENFVVEMKLDGWRLLAEVREDGVRLYSRTGIQYTGQLPHVEAEIAGRFPVGTWLDGEAVALTVTDGLVDVKWGVVQSVMTTTRRRHPLTDTVTFMVFDLISHGGTDARALPFVRRRALLQRIFEGAPFRHLALVPQYLADAFGEPDDAHTVFLSQGFEGTVVKRLNAPYASGARGAGWHKVKPECTLDAIVIGAKPGEGGFTGLIGALRFAQYDDDGNLIERGSCSGMTLAQRRSMTATLDDMVEAGTVIEVRYTELMPSGELRNARFHRLRPDRSGERVMLHD